MICKGSGAEPRRIFTETFIVSVKMQPKTDRKHTESVVMLYVYYSRKTRFTLWFLRDTGGKLKFKYLRINILYIVDFIFSFCLFPTVEQSKDRDANRDEKVCFIYICSY